MSDLYFAYGSNMSSARLRKRIPSAVARGAAALAGHRLVCNKRGKDGSGKANLEPLRDSVAWGVAFQVGAPDWLRLDAFEWGYERKECRIEIQGAHYTAQLYVALAPHAVAIPPFDWYRDHCLQGAMEHELPLSVVDEIASWSTHET